MLRAKICLEFWVGQQRRLFDYLTSRGSYFPEIEHAFQSRAVIKSPKLIFISLKRGTFPLITTLISSDLALYRIEKTTLLFIQTICPFLKEFRHFALFFRSPNITQPCPQVFSVNGSIICSGQHFWRHWFNVWPAAAGCGELCVRF